LKSNTQTNTNSVFFRYLQLLPVAAFALISSLPGHALAFSEDAGLSTTPFVFTQDMKLADARHLQGFPVTSEIPRIATALEPGMKVRLLATAYSSSTGQTDSNPSRTASGTIVHPGTLAANFLRFGAVVKINGQEYTVEDRLNERYNGRAIVDLWFPSQAEAFAFGVRVIELEIISLP
jgi:3D (Asp-Asp-Asp) domain-containing protein